MNMSNFNHTDNDAVVGNDANNDRKISRRSEHHKGGCNTSASNFKLMTPSSPGRTLTMFPFQLHQMLSQAASEGFDHVVSWLPCGRLFKVHDRTEFVATILHRFFNQTKFRSFQRQLNVYGFERIVFEPNAGAYFHPQFVRGQIKKCSSIKRQQGKKAPRKVVLCYEPLPLVIDDVRRPGSRQEMLRDEASSACDQYSQTPCAGGVDTTSATNDNGASHCPQIDAVETGGSNNLGLDVNRSPTLQNHRTPVPLNLIHLSRMSNAYPVSLSAYYHPSVTIDNSYLWQQWDHQQHWQWQQVRRYGVQQPQQQQQLQHNASLRDNEPTAFAGKAFHDVE